MRLLAGRLSGGGSFWKAAISPAGSTADNVPLASRMTEAGCGSSKALNPAGISEHTPVDCRCKRVRDQDSRSGRAAGMRIVDPIPVVIHAIGQARITGCETPESRRGGRGGKRQLKAVGDDIRVA